MKKKILWAIVLFTSFELSSAEIKIASGQSALNNIFSPIKEAYEKKSGNKLLLIHQRPAKSLHSLEEGQVQIAVAGLNWNEWIQVCKEYGVHIDTTRPFHYSSIGKDIINIYINPSNKLDQLSKEQVEGIFSGRIKNWKEIKKSGEEIKIYFNTDLSGTNLMFKRIVLQSKNYSQNMVKVKEIEEMLTKISNDKNGIGFGPHSLGSIEKKKNVKIINIPEKIGRPLFFVFLDPRPEIIDLKNFIASEEGQKLIKHSGTVSR